MLRAGAPIDGFGVGTNLTTSADVPAIDCVYKLQEYAGLPRRKQSVGKATLARPQAGVAPLRPRWPHGGRRALARERQPARRAAARAGHAQRQAPRAAAHPRQCARAGGARARPAARFPVQPRAGGPYPVEIADALSKMAAEVDRRLAPAK